MSDSHDKPLSDLPIELPMAQIAAFCTRWGISEFALFGSVLRDDFGPESDIDVLVRFSYGRRYTLKDVLQMEREITTILGRDVDLVDRDTVESSENYLRRRAILNSVRLVYAA